jgi:lysophospholipase L1-like esterase
VPGAYYRHVEEGFSEGFINSHGFRDYDRTYEKPNKTFRILVLGNSYAEAFQVALQDSFPAVLERRLNENSPSIKFEVLNLGQSGSGTAEEYTKYLNFGVKYSPDLVLLAFVTAADIRGNSKVFNTEISYFFDLDQHGNAKLDDSRVVEYGKTYTFSRSAFQTIKQHSYLASLISEWAFKLKYQQRQQNLENVMAGDVKSVFQAKLPESSSMNIYLPDMSERWKDAFAITEAGIRRIRDTVEENGSRFLLVTLTNAEQVHPDVEKQMRENYAEAFDFDQPERILKEFADKESIDYLELLPAFREYHLRTGKYLHGFGSGKGGHWNEKGHRLAAEKIFEFLKENRLVPLG